MMTLFEQFADPRAKKYLLMSTPTPSIIIVGIYLLLIYIVLPKFMQNRKSFALKKVIFFYNIFQITSCISLIAYIATPLDNSKFALVCEPMDYSNNPKSEEKLKICYLAYLLKISELLETVFFVLRKKQNQVSQLHVYHHASMVLMAWTMCKFFGGGMTVFAIMVNSFIHALMYSYYLTASLGNQWQKIVAKWKSSLTMLQMVQFAFLMGHGLQALNPKCGLPRGLLLVYVADVALIFRMFWNFYKKSYLKRDFKVKKIGEEEGRVISRRG